nr:immunoglobulin heavy chain junction region [Macaca mulatta]
RARRAAGIYGLDSW